jgi:hypothetical protein
MSFTTAAQARSIVRQNWPEKEFNKYRKLLDLVEQVIEGAAIKGFLSVNFKFDGDDITHARLIAKELHDAGFGVKLLYLGHRDITQGSQTDLEADSLTIYWGIDLEG